MSFNNWVGLEYLKKFDENGIRVDAVVIRGDRTNAEAEKIDRARTRDRYTPLFMGDVLNPMNTQIFFVKSHNAQDTASLLESLKPEVMVLGGTEILKPQILEKARWGTLNAHPGMLPKYRGCSCVEWAIYNDDPVGASCHLVSRHIDAGPVIYQEPLVWRAGWDYAEVRTHMIHHQAHVMLKGLQRFIKKPQGWPVVPVSGTYFKPIPPRELSVVKEKIRMKESLV